MRVRGPCHRFDVLRRSTSPHPLTDNADCCTARGLKCEVNVVSLLTYLLTYLYISRGSRPIQPPGARPLTRASCWLNHIVAAVVVMQLSIRPASWWRSKYSIFSRRCACHPSKVLPSASTPLITTRWERRTCLLYSVRHTFSSVLYTTNTV